MSASESKESNIKSIPSENLGSEIDMEDRINEVSSVLHDSKESSTMINHQNINNSQVGFEQEQDQDLVELNETSTCPSKLINIKEDGQNISLHSSRSISRSRSRSSHRDRKKRSKRSKKSRSRSRNKSRDKKDKK